MYSASVSTYPDSSSSRIFLQELKTQTEPGKPYRYSLKSLNDGEIKSRQPSFNGRQTIIRLDDGVHLIKLNGSKDEVAAFVNLNGNNTGKNDTFGIVKEANVNLEADEWKKVLLPWTVRVPIMTINLNQLTKNQKNTAKDTASATTTAIAIWATSSTARLSRSAGIWQLLPTTGWCISSKNRHRPTRLRTEAQLHPGYDAAQGY
ncbi:hypothetical protein [Neisseria gonorrhoeae]|uniref:hypothetical protein n=1 Tax=Neisseria gonorrhoeae TaxID=485 RepID=UPI0029653F6E|nr:hypothetical protein [Neisseria gonorrhoeae]